MKTIKYVISDELGIHARPAGIIVKLVKAYKSKILIGRPEKMVEATKIIGIMSLCMKQGDEIHITVEGEDESEAATAIETLLEENL